MDRGIPSLKLTVSCVVLLWATSVSSTLTPSGSAVSIDCGGQQTFTCALAEGGLAAWSISRLVGVTAPGSPGGAVAAASARVTTADAVLSRTSTITITGINASDNGGTVQCLDISGVPTVEGMATIAVATLTSAAVMANVDQCSTTLTWSEPSDSSATTSVSCTPSSPQCSSCTSSGCTIGGLTPNTSYTFSVTRSRSGCDDSTAVSSAVNTAGLPRCGLAGVVIGNDSCPSFTFTPQGSVLPSTVVVSYQLVEHPSSAGSMNCAYPVDSRTCRLVVPGGIYTVRVTPRNSCGSPSSTCPSHTVPVPAACELANSDPISTPTTATAISIGILSGVIPRPSVVLILTNIISVMVAVLVAKHCYKKLRFLFKTRRAVEGKKVYADINMTDSPAYGPTSHQ